MKRILLIEEDAAMRVLVQEWLGSASYVVEACDPAHIPAHTNPSLIVASMMNLRGPGAIELQNLHGRFPQVPVLVLSGQLGHSLSSDSEAALLLGVKALLAKPFARAELLAAVTEALAHGD